MDGDPVTVVVLDYLDVPGYGAYLRGDVAGFEKNVAEALIQQRRVRRFQGVLPTTPRLRPILRRSKRRSCWWPSRPVSQQP